MLPLPQGHHEQNLWERTNAAVGNTGLLLPVKRKLIALFGVATSILNQCKEVVHILFLANYPDPRS